MEFNIFPTAAALVAAAALTWLVLRFFFAPQRGEAGTVSNGRQHATITVKGGYSPAQVTMQAGMPITLTFDRKETGECTSHVVFADLGMDIMLPGNATTDVELPALPAGEYPFACGMNMVHGLLRVEGKEKDELRSQSDGSAEAERLSPPSLTPFGSTLVRGGQGWSCLDSLDGPVAGGEQGRYSFIAQPIGGSHGWNGLIA